MCSSFWLLSASRLGSSNSHGGETSYEEMFHRLLRCCNSLPTKHLQDQRRSTPRWVLAQPGEAVMQFAPAQGELKSSNLWGETKATQKNENHRYMKSTMERVQRCYFCVPCMRQDPSTS